MKTYSTAAPAIEIDGRRIAAGAGVFVVAEIGVNHDGSLERALQLVDIAADCGADAVKLQVFRAETLMHASSAFAAYQKERCDDSAPAEMLRRLELDRRQLRAIIEAARERGLVPLATPFSPADVATLIELKLPAVKIASPDVANPVLLGCCALAGKPLIISTGAATMDEVAAAVRHVRQLEAPLALLHCVSSYPAGSEDANLCWIAELAGAFACPVGYSDHTTDEMTGALAVAAGACIIEKHITYDRRAAGPDHAASCDPRQFAEYVRLLRRAEKLRGSEGKRVLNSERDVRTVSRQSLVLRHDIPAGQPLQMAHLTVQRPGTGIPAAELKRVLGRRVIQPLPAGTLLGWDMLSHAA